MPDDKEFQPHSNEEEQVPSGEEPEESDEENTEDDADDNKESFFKALLKVFKSVSQENNPEQEKATFATIVKLGTADNSVDGKKTEGQEKSAKEVENVKELLLLLFTPQPISQDGTTPSEGEESQAVGKIYEGILQAVGEAGFDVGEITDEVAELAKEKKPEHQEDPFEKLEEYLREKFKNASKPTLEALKKDLAKIRELSQAASEVDDQAEEAESLLKKVIKEVEEHHDDVEVATKSPQQINAEFAEIMKDQFEAMSEANRKDFEPEEENGPLTKQEEEEAELLKRIFFPKGGKKERTQLFAAMLDSVEADTPTEAAAIRAKLIRYAEHMGLEPRQIMMAQAELDKDFPREEEVNDLEAVPMTAFERMIEQQIVDAEPEEVEAMQEAWEEVRDLFDPESLEYEQANQAIDLLGQVIELKRNPDGARAEFIPPADDNEPESEEEETAKKKDRDKKNKTLAEVLAEIFKTSNPNSKTIDPTVMAIIVGVTLTSAETKEQAEAKLDEILAAFALEGDLASQQWVLGLQGFLNEHAWNLGILDRTQFLDLPESKGKAQVSENAFEQLLEEGLSNASREHLMGLQAAWAQVLLNPDLPEPLRMHIERANELVAGLIETSSVKSKRKADAPKRQVEKPDSADKKPDPQVQRIEKLEEALEKIEDKSLHKLLSQLVEKIKAEGGITGALAEKELENLTEKVEALKKILGGRQGSENVQRNCRAQRA